MVRRADQLLLPVNPLFMWLSVGIALMLNLLPLGRVAWLPDLLAVVLVSGTCISRAAWAWRRPSCWAC